MRNLQCLFLKINRKTEEQMIAEEKIDPIYQALLKTPEKWLPKDNGRIWELENNEENRDGIKRRYSAARPGEFK